MILCLSPAQFGLHVFIPCVISYIWSHSHFPHRKQSTGCDWMHCTVNTISPAKTLMIVTNDKRALTHSGQEILLKTEKNLILHSMAS